MLNLGHQTAEHTEPMVVNRIESSPKACSRWEFGFLRVQPTKEATGHMRNYRAIGEQVFAAQLIASLVLRIS